jgi:hypothetical protein
VRKKKDAKITVENCGKPLSGAVYREKGIEVTAFS